MVSLAGLNFRPLPDQTQTISVTTTSSSVTFSSPSGRNRQIRVYNAGAETAFLKWAKGSATATADDDMPVPSGAIEVFNFGEFDTVAAITASATATVYVTLGVGRG